MIRGRISVLIACYQHGHWLDGALKSVFAQTAPDIEAVVANDGSTDDTDLVAHRWQQREPRRVTLVNTARVGQAAARRAALERASGEFYITLDADDLLEPRMAERCAAALAQEPEAIVAAADVWMVDESGTRALRLLEQGSLPGWPGVLMSNPLGGVGGLLVRRETAERIGGLTLDGLSGVEDWDFAVRLTRAGLRVVRVPEALARYRQSRASFSRNPLPMLKARLELLDRCRKPDERLELPPAKQPVIDEAAWRRLRNRQVFFVLGLAAVGSAAAMPEVLASRVAGENDWRAWARAFAEGVGYAALAGGSGKNAAARARLALTVSLASTGEGALTEPLLQAMEQAVRRTCFPGPRYWKRRIAAWLSTRRFRRPGGAA